MPRKVGKDKVRSYRAPDDVYDPAMAAAKDSGVDLAEVIRDALVEFTRRWSEGDGRPATAARETEERT